METFEKLKERIVILYWFFALISIVIFVCRENIHNFSPFLFYLLLTLIIVINIIMTVPATRRMLTPKIFFVVIVFYAIIIASLIYMSENTAIFQTVIDSPFSLIYLFPIIIAGIYYGLPGAFIMATVVTVLDITTSILQLYYSKGDSILNAFNVSLLIRVSLYYLLAFFISNTEQDKKQIVMVKDEKAEEYLRQIQELENLNKKVQKDIQKIEEEKNDIILGSKQNELLLNISQTLSQNLDLKDILSATLRKIRELVVYHSGAIFLFNSDRAELKIAAHEGLYEEEMQKSLRADIGIPYIVAQTIRPLLIEDTKSDPRFGPIIKTANIRSAIYLPITKDNEVFGVICLWGMQEQSYGKNDIQLLTTITNEAARSINNAELYRKLDTRLNFIVTLWQASKSLTTSLDLSSSWEKVLEEVLKTTGYLFNSDKLIFFQYRKEHRELYPYITINISEATRKNFIIKIKNEPAGISEFFRSNFQVKDMRTDVRYSMMAPFALREDFTSMLWSPLIGRNRVVGALALFTKEPRTWTQEEIQWMDIFTNMFSMTLENVLLLFDLVSEKSQLQTLIDNVPEGVYTTDSQRNILTWNRAAEKITGFKMSEVVGKDCCSFIKCQSIDNVLCEENCPVKTAMEKQEKVDSGMENMFVLNKENEKIPVFLTSAPIFNEEGQVEGSIMVFRDITKEKEIERMKEEFLATITHDLKSPLASIMGYAELLLNPKLGTISTGQKEFLEAILRSSKTLQILINNILESTRMEAGKMTYNPVLFKLSDLIDEIAEMFRPLLAHKSLNFKSIVDTSAVVFGDREKINEVFINLVSNALKFTPEGGLIAISAKKVEGKVEISVSDTGKGIPESEVSKLFQKFSQVKGEKRGTGLGLYICRKILEIHEQTIWVESKLGEGTTFSFTLSTYKPEAKTSDGHKILIVESDESLAQMIERYFFEQKYEVKIASGMKEVKEILQTSDVPRIAIIDWQLPNNEAIEIMDYIRGNEKTEDMAILVLCDYREDIGGDFDAVVNKPINFKDLLMKANAFAQT
ncbi:MAG: ATP-binding protein [Firmicutes bacterium]|nr:ATP-binding protein [Bacillota bacterium]